MTDPLAFEFTGSPLAEIIPGVYDLSMSDGSTLLAIVDRSEDGTPWWAPCAAPDAVVDCSTDWSSVVGAIAVGVEELTRRRPDLFDQSDIEKMRAMRDHGPVSISGRGAVN